jgi:hypothetical protein
MIDVFVRAGWLDRSTEIDRGDLWTPFLYPLER